MSEWIKFDFDMLSETTACDLVVHLNGGQVDKRRIGSNVDFYDPSENVVAKKATVWVEIDDAMAADTGDHKIRINVVERLHPDTGETMYDIPEIELTKITVNDQEHTPATASINDSIKTYNILDAEFQTLIDAGEFNHDSEVSQDFGNGITTYSVSSWQNNKVKGNGVWTLEFSCPFENWYNSIHND